MKPHRFWSFNISQPSAKHGRWEVEAADDDWAWPIRVRLREGRPLAEHEWPSPPPVFTYTKPTPLRDIPWPRGVNIFIVSDPLRRFLEAEAPGAAEYLPIRLQGPGSEQIPEPYWAMNWVRVFDCLDEEESMDVDENGKRFVQIPVVDTARIPEDGVLGLLKGYTVEKLIRDDLKRKMEKAGFKGPVFGRIAQIHRAPEPAPKPKPKGRAAPARGTRRK